jgi:hypothetical protein
VATIYEVAFELDEFGRGRVTLDGRPLSVKRLKIETEIGEMTLATFTVYARVSGTVKDARFVRHLVAGEDLREGQFVTIDPDGLVRREAHA